MKYQLTIPQWLDLPFEIRQKLKEIFKIPRSTGSHVVGSQIISDGHTHNDLSVVSIEAMQVFTESKGENFWELLDATIKKVMSLCQHEKDEKDSRVKEESERSIEAKAEALGALALQMQAVAEGATQVMAKKRGRPAKVV